MIETLASMAEWAGSNMAYNLKFIPNDKLNWKHAPDAASALEVINHAVLPLLAIPEMLAGREGKPDFTPATTREEAQELIRSASAGYAIKLRPMPPQDLEGLITMPFVGEWPRAHAVSLPVIDLIHHGQIAYIQTLLGDKESHFEEMGN